MPDLRCVFGFKAAAGPSLPDVGWTETWYQSGVSVTQGVSNADAYVAVRKELLGRGAGIESVTLHDIAVKRSAYDRVYTPAQGRSSIYTATADEHDVVQYDLLIRFSTLDGSYSRPFFLAALPDELVSRARQRGVEAAFLTSAAMNAFLNYVETGIFKSYLKDKLNPPPAKTFVSFTQHRFRYMKIHKRGRPFPLYRGRN